MNVKPIMLLMAHMNGLRSEYGLDIQSVEKDMEMILRYIPSYLDIMMAVCRALVNEQKLGRSQKRVTAKNVLALI